MCAGCTAVKWWRRIAPDPSKAVPLQVVVVAEFGAGFDGLLCKDADPGLSLHHPVLRLAVGAARVVQVACDAALGCRVQQQAPAPRLGVLLLWGAAAVWAVCLVWAAMAGGVGVWGHGSSLDVCHDVCMPHVSVCIGHAACQFSLIDNFACEQSRCESMQRGVPAA